MQLDRSGLRHIGESLGESLLGFVQPAGPHEQDTQRVVGAREFLAQFQGTPKHRFSFFE